MGHAPQRGMRPKMKGPAVKRDLSKLKVHPRTTATARVVNAWATGAVPSDSECDRRHHRYVVRRSQPTSRFLHDGVAGHGILQWLSHPDMVEPTAAVGLFPIARAV